MILISRNFDISKKKVFVLIGICLCTLFSSAANNLKVVATNSILHDIAQHICGDNYELISLIPVGGDPHLYDPIPSDVEAIAKADIVIKNGLHLEGWLNKLIDNSGTNALIIEASKGIKAIQSLDHANSYDPHAWMNITNGKIYARNICNAFIEINPDHEAYYINNLSIYLEKLDVLDDYIKTIIQSIPKQQRILITSHDAFQYFSRAYDIRVEAAAGISTEAEVRTGDLNKLIQLIKDYEIPSIFVESTINPKLLEQLAKDLGIKIGGELFADSLDDPEEDAGTYAGMLKHNAETIKAGLLAQKHQTNNQSITISFILVTTIILLFVLWIVTKKVIQKGEGELGLEFNLVIKGLTVSYGYKTILNNIFLGLNSGRLVGVIGANGSGKSTLLKSILGIASIDSGGIHINGKSIGSFASKIAYLPQKDEIDTQFPVTVKDVVLMGRNAIKQVGAGFNKADYQLMNDALEELGLKAIKDRQISEISGGQLQRVFIARALCQEASILMLDEPFVGVDVTTEEKIIQILKGLAKQGKMIIMVHHDLSKVTQYFDDVIMMNQRVVAYGNVAETFTNENIQKTFEAQLPILHQKDQFIR